MDRFTAQSDNGLVFKVHSTTEEFMLEMSVLCVMLKY